MIGKLIKLAVTTGLAKKAYDMYREKQAEKRALDAMAAQIQPQAGDTSAKPARKQSTRRRRKADAPAA